MYNKEIYLICIYNSRKESRITFFTTHEEQHIAPFPPRSPHVLSFQRMVLRLRHHPAQYPNFSRELVRDRSILIFVSRFLLPMVQYVGYGVLL